MDHIHTVRSTIVLRNTYQSNLKSKFKIPSKIDFELNRSDFIRNFSFKLGMMSSNYGLMVVLIFFTSPIFKDIFVEQLFELEKSNF